MHNEIRNALSLLARSDRFGAHLMRIAIAIAILCVLLLTVSPLGVDGAETSASSSKPSSVPPPTHHAFSPPAESTMPNDEFGKLVRLGEQIFVHPSKFAKAYVGNALSCSNCHLEAGRKADSAPLWAAYVSFPAYRIKSHSVMTYDQRLQDCFRYSMNGKAPPLGSKVLLALDAYSYWLASGAVVDPHLPGRGYAKIAVPATPPDFDRGRAIYSARCALCHGAEGSGQVTPDGTVVFPALWGRRSFNWGAGMANISNATGFIKLNMPLTQPNSLSDQEAYDVATYIDSQERPQDPRFTGSVAQTRVQFHDTTDSMYGKPVNGHLLGTTQAR
jgi:thiosulfate dehydrogenase